jgi:hypothetical protein
MLSALFSSLPSRLLHSRHVALRAQVGRKLGSDHLVRVHRLHLLANIKKVAIRPLDSPARPSRLGLRRTRSASIRSDLLGLGAFN